jgi:CheY-like chemotaxis protein
MGKLKKRKVHIADDHKVLIDGIKAVLKREETIEVVGSSQNGEEVLDWYASNSSDVLILDINMPKIDGINILQEFSKWDAKPLIVDLQYDELASGENYDKNFTAKATLRIKFHQQPATGADKYREPRPPKPVPEIVIEP